MTYWSYVYALKIWELRVDSSKTHWTGFAGRVDCTAAKIKNLEFLGCGPYHIDFGMGCRAVCRFFCKITNLNKLSGRKSHIRETKLHTICKNLTLNFQQIRDTAFLLKRIPEKLASHSMTTENAEKTVKP
jgi:hypothetical protein